MPSDFTQSFRLAGVPLFGHHTNIGTDGSAAAKASWIIEHCHHCFGQARAYAARRLQQTHVVIRGAEGIQLRHHLRELHLHCLFTSALFSLNEVIGPSARMR